MNSISFSPDGELLASASRDQTLRIWSLAAGESLHALQGHSGSVEAVAFSPDGSLLASGGEDQQVLLWGPSPSGDG